MKRLWRCTWLLMWWIVWAVPGITAAPEARKVIIDTDPGVDDAMAVLLALNSPELEVKAITVVAGNVVIDEVSRMRSSWFR